MYIACLVVGYLPKLHRQWRAGGTTHAPGRGDASRVHEVPPLGSPLAPPLQSLPVRRAAPGAARPPADRRLVRVGHRRRRHAGQARQRIRHAQDMHRTCACTMRMHHAHAPCACTMHMHHAHAPCIRTTHHAPRTGTPAERRGHGGASSPLTTARASCMARGMSNPSPSFSPDSFVHGLWHV